VLKVLTDILYAVDDGDLFVLALLDPSLAFDADNHDILLTRFKVSFGVSDAVLDWFQCYWTSKVDSVHCGSALSIQKSSSSLCPKATVSYIVLLVGPMV